MLGLDRRYRWYRIVLMGPDRSPTPYVFRGVTRGELVASGSRQTAVEAEDYLLQCSCPTISDLGSEWAGTCKALLQQIYRVSGLDDEGLPYKEAIAWLNDEEGKYEAVAVAMVPGCSPEILRTCDPSDRARFLLIGKFMYETIYGRPIEEAFTGSSGGGQGGVVGPEPMPTPDRGEVATWTQEGFQWQRT